ncbi:MAG: hypothetical protein GXO94_08505 [Nitrospirae bacterium]|nr:hypothetical protein [Nitrospirota bacterium]
MKDSFSTAERTAVAGGYLFVAVGIVLNEWLLASLFSSDGNLRLLSRIIIWAFDILSIGAGLALIYFGRTRQLKNLLILVVTLIICAVLAEAFLRLLEPKPVEGLYLELSDSGSYRLRPDVNVETKFGVIRTNSYGMGWKEVSPENPLNKTRIAFVGDSFTFGLWADSVESGAVGVVASMLDPERFEVLNFGVPGYGPPDTELQITRDVLAFRPDYVFLLFYNGNDFRDAYLGVNKYHIVNGAQIWDRDNERNMVPAAFRSTSLMYCLERLATYRRLDRLISIVTKDKKKTDGRNGFKVSRIFSSQSFWSHKVYPDVAVRARDEALESMENIRRILSRNGIQLVIVTIPYEEQVYTASLTGEDYDLTLPQRYVQEYAEAHSVPYLDLLPILRAYVQEEDEHIYVPNDIHFNNRGHYVVGKAIADFFKGRFVQ